MNSPKFRFSKQILPSSAAAVALLGLIGIANPAKADVYSLCPSIAQQGGFNNSFTTSGCSVTMSTNIATDYAKLTWGNDASVTTPGYPAVTLGELVSGSANVTAVSGGNPFYELAFTDSSDSLGQGAATDQILFIEFQPSTVSGTTMALDANSTLFNVYDNTTGVYLEGGQADTKTVAGWLGADSSLSAETLQEVRIGIGLAGGAGPGESATVNSFELTSTVPEPTSILLLLTIVGITLWGVRRAPRAHRG